jgi:hypothetical protein
MSAETLVVKSDNNILFESYYQQFILECINHKEYNRLNLLRLNDDKKKEAHERAYLIMTNETKRSDLLERERFIEWLLTS